MVSSTSRKILSKVAPETPTTEQAELCLKCCPKTLRNSVWLEQLETLVNRYSHLGMGEDLSSMSQSELWGLYVMLVQCEMNERDE